MKRFDLYCMIFLTMDHYWDIHKGERLGQFLSSMNPYLFEGEGSAVPEYYRRFCKMVDDREIELDESYRLANVYIECIGDGFVKEAFGWVDEETWIRKCEKYLESDE
ncbi:MAG: hypothetical protein VZQ98_14430 [Bacteroidales bacterium]|nr:hypothetical protein [Bacteroidales bacterium]